MNKTLMIRRIAFAIWIGCNVAVEITYGLSAYILTIVSSFALGLSWIYNNEENDK